MEVSQVTWSAPTGCQVYNRLAFLSWMDDVCKIVAEQVGGVRCDLACDIQDEVWFLNVITYPDERKAFILEDAELIQEVANLADEWFKGIKNQVPALDGGEPGGADGTLDCISP